MKDLWMDPVVMGAAGVIVVGFVLLILALRALGKSAKPKPIKEFDFPTLRTPPPLSVVSPDSNPFSANAVVPPPAPVANKDVLNKVDLISQRLVDMQMLLNKQVMASANAGNSAMGLSPEIMDKLLKIASTVAQQVEVLQKELGGDAAAVPAMRAEAAPAPTAMPAVTPPPVRTTPTMTSVSQVIGNTSKTPNPPANP